MDTVKIGEFLKRLRKEQALTQVRLGEKIGVTNKTISRWKNGEYLPSVDMLKVLSEEYGVTINEILNGERLNDETEFKQAAEENLTETLENSVFTLKEKVKFWKKRWYKNNLFSLIVSGIIFVLLLTYSQIESNINVGIFSVVYGYAMMIVFNNRKMAYIEKNAYSKGK